MTDKTDNRIRANNQDTRIPAPQLSPNSLLGRMQQKDQDIFKKMRELRRAGLNMDGSEFLDKLEAMLRTAASVGMDMERQRAARHQPEGLEHLRK